MYLCAALCRLIALVLAFLFVGCSSFDVTKYEKGAIWCNEPLKYAPGVHFDGPHLEVARRGYMYALAAAYVLQTTNKEGEDHWFELPARLRVGDVEPRDTSGFEVRSFKLFDAPGDTVPAEVIVAFVGSNDRDDWVLANLMFDRKQYDLARAYVRKTAEKYPNTRLVVAGFSLGGALAGHVTKHRETSSLVAQAWLFNPSSKLYGNDHYDRRIWVGAMRGEMLNLIRNRFMETVWPGINRIGSPWNQTAEDYYLISANPIYAHFRWALARNILFVADYAHLQHPIGPMEERRRREPREIIEQSRFKACEAEKGWAALVASRRAEQEAIADRNMRVQGEAEEQSKVP